MIKSMPLYFVTKRLHVRPLLRNDYQEWREAYRSAMKAQSIFDDGILAPSEITFQNFLSILRNEKKRILPKSNIRILDI